MRLSPAVQLLRLNVVLAAATFLSSVLLARTLEPASRGELANLVLWPTFLANIGLLGVHIYLARQTAADGEAAAANYRVGIRAVVVMSMLLSLLCAAIFFSGAVPSFSGIGWTAALVAILILPFSAWSALQLQMELGRSNFHTYNWARGSFTVSYLALIAMLWAVQLPQTICYLLAYLCAAVFATASTYLLINRELRRSAVVQRPTVDHAPGLVDTMQAAWPFGLSTGAIALASAVDRIALSLLFDARTMGLYVIALAMSQLQSVINESISPLFFPRLSQKHTIGSANQEWLAMRLRQVVLINAVIGVALMIAAPLLLPIIFGWAYTGALDIVYLLIPSMCARSAMRPFEEVLKGGNRPIQQSAAFSAMVVVFIAGAALAAAANSVQGIALALLFASLTGLGVVAMAVARETSAGIVRLLLPCPKDAAALLSEILSILRPRNRV